MLTMSLASEDDDSHMTRWLVSGLLTGGSTKTHEKARLRKGVPILVSTPGRLLDHLQNTASFKCAKTMFLVLDEADRLMDLGFEETVQGIIKALDARRRTEIRTQHSGSEESAGMMKWPYWSRGRQTILCSATVDAKVEKLAGTALQNPMVFRGTAEPSSDLAVSKSGSKVDQAVEAALYEANAISLPTASEDKFTPPSQLAQKFVVVPTKLRLVALVALLRTLVSPKKQLGDTGTKVIVFLSSTDAVDFHWKLLGGVQMGGDATPAAAAQANGEEDSAGQESADEEGEVEGEAPKKAKKAAKVSSEDQVALSSPLFPNTTVHRLHGSLPLRTRLASLASFAASSATPSILLATSVASRGLDLPLVRAVIQYDLPTEGGANEYVHRVGRTARAGKGGEAWAFVGPSERDWVGWVEARMGGVTEGGQPVKMGEDRVEDILKRGFGGKGFEYEGRATEVQLAFERWVLADDPNAALARKAYSSFIRAYSTHPLEEKKFFHPKSLHLGHLAKSFALREAPGALTKSSKPAKPAPGSAAASAAGKKRKRGDGVADGAGDDDSDEEKGGKETTARNETERRMYEAVRKAGRSIRSGGKLGEFGNARARDAEFHVMGTGELEKMLGGKMP